MITLFRRIRQKLIDSGSFTKYLLYAIGEILLVVIGILIALQVNNWNIYRLERAEERQILVNLRTEFDQAITQLNYLNGLRDNSLSSADSLISLSNANGPFVEDTLDSLLMWQSYTPTFNDPTGSLSSLISSNKINLISDNELKLELLSWPRESEDMIEDETRAVIIHDDLFRPFTHKYISMANMIEKYQMPDNRFGLVDEEMVGLVPSRYVQSDYQSLLRNPEFINTLHTKVIFANLSKNESINLISKAEGIIDMINQTLDE
ncbi:DUF6090 family protein [Rhodohalobacter mucosus]|uniref:Uncharacterized protein n=1 Tax=Rhodohalobacter mucosus TaxID=2079485 RepID=A0A316TT72_9BACT|nr:DUF6090 family protein [Rhodohalobacter mucosus]PWN05484.1 hypothetical protein DDZ15_12805 [Rhodohalobacter mucosus]